MAFKILSEEEPSTFKSLPEEERGSFKILPEVEREPYDQPELPYMAKHPNLYAAEETAKDLAKGALHLIPYTKYLHPEERDRFMKLEGKEGGTFWEPKTKVQAQVRELLYENLFAELLILPTTKGGKHAFGAARNWMAKNFPKTFNFLTKPRMVSKLAQEEIVIEAAKQTPEVQKITQAIKEAKPIRKEQERLYTQERAKRIARLKKVASETTGEESYYAQLRELKGPLPKVEYESIRTGSNPWEMTKDEFFNNYRFHGSPYDLKEGIKKGSFFSDFNYAKGYAKEPGLPPGSGKIYAVKSSKLKPTNAEPLDVFGQSEIDNLASIRSGIPHKGIEVRSFDPHKKIVEEALVEGKYVPQNVLNEYPDLIKKYPNKQPKITKPILTQSEVDTLFDTIKHSDHLNVWEKLPAQKGLAKMLGEFGGKVPTEDEIAKLAKVFGRGFVEAAMEKRTMFAKYKDLGMQVANVPRAVMASFDFSAPLRQGVFLIGRPKRFFNSALKSFKPFFSERTYQGMMEEIFSRPTAELMKESGLSLTHLGRGLKGREEVFMSSLAERIPLVGKGVRASERAYVSFLNKLRADVFDDFVKKGTELGIKDPIFFKDAARFINTATGRGELKFGFDFEPAAEILNTWFFSPRLIASRINLLRPSFYVGLEPTVRKEALKDLLKFGSIATSVAGLATLSGADIETDPTSADFMKIRYGNTRYDFLGGFQQPVRLAAQLITGKIKSSTTGKTMVLGEGYRALTRPEIALRFLEYKQAPVVSFGVGLMRGKNALGEKFDIPTEVANRFIPMVAQDMKELYQEKGFEGIAMASPAIFGVGVQTYGGVQSFGMNGKDYPKLNNELLRLKTSMGYPSTMAFGYSLTNNEYKLLKRKTGIAIANDLNKFINSDKYMETDDQRKVGLIEHRIDRTKQIVKNKLFSDKKRKSEYKSYLKNSKGITGEEAEKMAIKYLKEK